MSKEPSIHTGKKGRPRIARVLALRTMFLVAMEYLDGGRFATLTMPRRTKRELARGFAAEAWLRLSEVGLRVVPAEVVPSIPPAEGAIVEDPSYPKGQP